MKIYAEQERKYSLELIIITSIHNYVSKNSAIVLL